MESKIIRGTLIIISMWRQWPNFYKDIYYATLIISTISEALLPLCVNVVQYVSHCHAFLYN